MDVSLIETIGNLGFNGLLPAILCVYLITTGARREERTIEMVEELRRAVDRNTKIIQRLMDRMAVKGESYEC